jgi:hypothetical protein
MFIVQIPSYARYNIFIPFGTKFTVSFHPIHAESTKTYTQIPMAFDIRNVCIKNGPKKILQKCGKFLEINTYTNFIYFFYTKLYIAVC